MKNKTPKMKTFPKNKKEKKKKKSHRLWELVQMRKKKKKKKIFAAGEIRPVWVFNFPEWLQYLGQPEYRPFAFDDGKGFILILIYFFFKLPKNEKSTHFFHTLTPKKLLDLSVSDSVHQQHF